MLKILKKGTCVKKCPNNATITIDCHPTKYMNETTTKYIGCSYYPAGKTSLITFLYETKAVGRFCLPTGIGGNAKNMTAEVIESIKSTFFSTTWGKKLATYFYDVVRSWPV
jgi:hypothetical protein